jgi:hypothetical protein
MTPPIRRDCNGRPTVDTAILIFDLLPEESFWPESYSIQNRDHQVVAWWSVTPRHTRRLVARKFWHWYWARRGNKTAPTWPEQWRTINVDLTPSRFI